VYTLNLKIKKAATPEKTTGYGFNPLEKIWFYSKLTLDLQPLQFLSSLKEKVSIMIVSMSLKFVSAGAPTHVQTTGSGILRSTAR